jgi:dihydrolipoamide dehydrogenase
VVLVATAGRPTPGPRPREAGVKLDDKGRIAVDEHFETSVPGIYAIGDVIRGPMLAHKAEDEGVAVAEILAGQAGHVNYGVIPVVYTDARDRRARHDRGGAEGAGIEYRAGKFPFTGQRPGQGANQTTDGFVKVLADAATDRVLGVHIVGPQAPAS